MARVRILFGGQVLDTPINISKQEESSKEPAIGETRWSKGKEKITFWSDNIHGEDDASLQGKEMGIMLNIMVEDIVAAEILIKANNSSNGALSSMVFASK